MNTLGVGAQAVANNNYVADDFTLSASTFINTITFFAFQAGSTTTSTMTGARVRIVTGDPTGQTRDANPVVFGDLSTNRMASTSFTGVYRVTSTTLTGTTRPIMRIVATIGTTLPAGTYWLQWGLTGSLTNGPWAVPPAMRRNTFRLQACLGLEF